MAAAARRPSPTAAVAVRSPSRGVPAGEDFRPARALVPVHLDDAVGRPHPVEAVEKGQVGVLAEGEHQGVGLELLELPRRSGEAGRRRGPCARAPADRRAEPETVESHRMVTPSSEASSTSSAWAGIWSRVRR